MKLAERINAVLFEVAMIVVLLSGLYQLVTAVLSR